MSVNKVILIGNVGKDPEVRHLDMGVAVANLSLATSESYTAKNGDRVETTEWHNIVFWRGLAEVVEKYVRKGSKLYIEGRIKSRSYDDKDGIKRYITEIYADNMQMLDRKEAGATPEPAMNKGQQPSSNKSFSPAPEETYSGDHEEDDLPF